MTEIRSYAAAAMFEGLDDLWWITGGYNAMVYISTETYATAENDFVPSVVLPQEVWHHNLINVNNTHMVIVGSEAPSDEIVIYDRYDRVCERIRLDFQVIFLNVKLLAKKIHF